MGKKFSLIVLSVTSLFLNSAMAENVYSEQFQTIRSVELHEIVQGENGEEQAIVLTKQSIPTYFETLAKRQGLTKVNKGNILMVTRELIALGKEIYKIVEAGKPVATVTSEPIQVLPLDSEGNTVSAMQLNNWQTPSVKKYRVAVKNYLNISPVTMEFMLIFSYGGENQGKGKYITGAQLRPTNVSVKWGYKLDAEFKVQSIMNQGSSDQPIAGAVLMLDYKISTILQDEMYNKTFFINGLGEVTSY